MTRPWDASRIAEVRARCEAATLGPWFAVGTPWGDGTTVNAGQEDPHGGAAVCDCDPHGLAEEEEAYRCEDDAAFISSARTDLPEALDEIERLRTCLEWLDARGGLGRDVHDEIAKALGKPTHAERFP